MKRDFLRILSAAPARSLRGMVLGLLIFGAATRMADNFADQQRAATRSVAIRYDTVQMTPKHVENIRTKGGVITGGIYTPRANSIQIKTFEMAPGYENPDAAQALDALNDFFSAAAWHEIRHAYNYNIISRANTTRLGVDTYAYDEFFATVAEFICLYLDMPNPVGEHVSFDVNYKIPADDFQFVIDLAIAQAYDKLQHTVASEYEPLFRRYSKNNIFNGRGHLTEDVIRDSLRIFRINGKRIDILDAASHRVRGSALEYLDQNRAR